MTLVECEGCQVHNLNCKTGNAVLHGFGADGFFTEYVVVNYQNAIILPSDMNMKTSAPVFCAGITGMSFTLAACSMSPG